MLDRWLGNGPAREGPPHPAGPAKREGGLHAEGILAGLARRPRADRVRGLTGRRLGSGALASASTGSSRAVWRAGYSRARSPVAGGARAGGAKSPEMEGDDARAAPAHARKLSPVAEPLAGRASGGAPERSAASPDGSRRPRPGAGRLPALPVPAAGASARARRGARALPEAPPAAAATAPGSSPALSDHEPRSA